jgi:YD repeat-containing protein
MSFEYETNKLTTQDERGYKTYEYYDLKDRLLHRVQYEGINQIETFNYYDGLGNTIKTIDGNGNVSEKVYDMRNLLAEEHLPQDTFVEPGIPEGQLYTPVIKHIYDDAGFKIADTLKINGSDYTITYIPDPLGRTIGTSKTYTDYSKAGNPQVTINQSVYYDPNGNKKKIVDANGHETKYTYTARDKVHQEIDPAGGITSYGYDDEDNKTSMTDPRGNTGTYTGDFTINYTYDDLKRLVKGELPRNNDTPDKPAVTLEYDPRGNLVKRTEQDGLVTEYAYSSRNKVLTETRTGKIGRAHV